MLVLTHEDRLDRPALTAALATAAFYVGALGSRRNQERRRERMLVAGVDEEALQRISGRCGLDIGAESQEETAISIIAEMLAVRAGRAGGRLREAGQRIHTQAVSGRSEGEVVPWREGRGIAAGEGIPGRGSPLARRPRWRGFVGDKYRPAVQIAHASA